MEPRRIWRLGFGVSGACDVDASLAAAPKGSSLSSIKITAFGPDELRLSFCGEESQLLICPEAILSLLNNPITEEREFSKPPEGKFLVTTMGKDYIQRTLLPKNVADGEL